jgi:hypothetical protein
VQAAAVNLDSPGRPPRVLKVQEAHGGVWAMTDTDLGLSVQVETGLGAEMKLPPQLGHDGRHGALLLQRADVAQQQIRLSVPVNTAALLPGRCGARPGAGFAHLEGLETSSTWMSLNDQADAALGPRTSVASSLNRRASRWTGSATTTLARGPGLRRIRW